MSQALLCLLLALANLVGCDRHSHELEQAEQEAARLGEANESLQRQLHQAKQQVSALRADHDLRGKELEGAWQRAGHIALDAELLSRHVGKLDADADGIATTLFNELRPAGYATEVIVPDAMELYFITTGPPTDEFEEELLGQLKARLKAPSDSETHWQLPGRWTKDKKTYEYYQGIVRWSHNCSICHMLPAEMSGNLVSGETTTSKSSRPLILIKVSIPAQ